MVMMLAVTMNLLQAQIMCREVTNKNLSIWACGRIGLTGTLNMATQLEEGKT